MQTITRRLGCAVLALAALAVHAGAHAQSREEAKLASAARVLDELRGQPDTAIPERLLQSAYGVAVIPGVTKVAFILGGRRGNGVLTVRDSRGRFTNPVFVNLTGGSVGFQVGAQESDVVLVFTTRSGIEGISDGKLTLGVGASVAAGPVGRQAEAAAGANAEVLAYAKSRGVFAGVSLDGTALSMDARSNRAFYANENVLPSDIMNGSATTDSENARRFLASLAVSTGEASVNRSPAPAAPSAPVPSAPVNPSTAPSEVRTFPMEDPSPGAEPPR